MIVWATGYEYDFPFLESSVASVEQRGVRPLFHQLFHANKPSLAFVGLPHSVVPFPLFFLQAKRIAAAWHALAAQDRAGAEAEAEVEARGALPDEKARLGWLAAFESQHTDSPRNYHYLGDAQWAYCQRLAEDAGLGGAELEGWLTFLATNREIYK
jgi:hypothetical protein